MVEDLLAVKVLVAVPAAAAAGPVVVPVAAADAVVLLEAPAEDRTEAADLAIDRSY